MEIPYDLVCEECRRKFDLLEPEFMRAKTAEEEMKVYNKWLSQLCPSCRKLLEEEGYIVREKTPHSSIKESEELLKLIREKGLYRVLEDEFSVNRNLKLSDAERDEIIKVIKGKGVEIEPEEVYTIGDIEDYFLSYAKDAGVPDKFVDYLDVVSMLVDEITGGYLAYGNFERDGRNFLVFYWTK